MAFPAPLLLPILLPLERIINAALKSDEISLKRLGELNDKVIAIHETSFDVCVGIAIVANEVQILNEFDGESDVKLTGELSSLMALMKSSDALYGSGIRIEGQLSDAEKLRSIVGQLDVDIESLLAPIAGGTIAHQAGRLFEGASAFFKSASEKTQLNAKEYLQEEANILVPPTLAEEFAEQVTELREGVDRAEARLRRLEQKKSVNYSSTTSTPPAKNTAKSTSATLSSNDSESSNDSDSSGHSQ